MDSLDHLEDSIPHLRLEQCDSLQRCLERRVGAAVEHERHFVRSTEAAEHALHLEFSLGVVRHAALNRLPVLVDQVVGALVPLGEDQVVDLLHDAGNQRFHLTRVARRNGGLDAGLLGRVQIDTLELGDRSEARESS